jgi:predicted transcriptional regulator
MKPLEILRRYQDGTTLVDDCVLEQIMLLDQPVTTQIVVNQCLLTKIASHATLHKALQHLMDAGWIKKVKHPTDTDNRKRWLTYTAAGERRIKELS